MFKKLIIASAIVLSSTTAFAGAAYLGAGIGVNHQMFKDKVDVVESGITVPLTYNFGGIGPVFNLSAGYGSLINQNVYLGGEILANFTASDVDGVKMGDNDNSITAKFKTKYSYGASFIPGLMVSDKTMAYARVGVVQTRFNTKVVVTTDGSEEEFVGSKEDKTVTGGQFGLGLQTKVAQNLDLRGEYVYTAYKAFEIGDTKINASSGQATVGLVYKFE